MQYDWLSDYCTGKPAAIKDYKPEWGAFRYMVHDKMFLMEGADKAGEPIISVKLEPLRGEFLRAQYKGSIIPGYYMNKVHWNSIYKSSELPEALVREMIDESYMLIVQGLPKKLQKELFEQA